MKKALKGQSILEYTLVLGAVIAVIVAVLFGNNGIQARVTAAYNATGTALDHTVADINHGIFQ